MKEEKPSYYEDIRSLGENLLNNGSNINNAIKNSVSNYLYGSYNLKNIFSFIEKYFLMTIKEIKRLKLLYNYTEKENSNRINF